MAYKPVIVYLDPLISDTKIAPREIRGPKTSEAALAAAAPRDPVSDAIEQCRLRFEEQGQLLDWGNRAAPVLEAALRLRLELDKAPAAVLDRLRKQPWMQVRARSLSEKKPDIACVHACRAADTKAARKENSRFALVVRQAFVESIKPEEAASWLAPRTMSEIIAGGRTPRPRETFSIKLPKKSFPRLAKAYSSAKAVAISNDVLTILQKAAADCEKILEAQAAGEQA